MNYKLLIPTSGIGSRLGELTKSTNKALLKVNGKIIIDSIIDSYNKDTSIVITLGWCGSQVKTYLLKNYAHRDITFVEVDNYNDVGSGLAYSLNCAKDKLQCPFFFNSCDTLPNKHVIPELLLEGESVYRNWIGICNVEVDCNYSKVIKDDKGLLQQILSKTYPCVNSHMDTYIALSYIHDYTTFWKATEQLLKSNIVSPCDTDIYEHMNIPIYTRAFPNWVDTGNVKSKEFVTC
jgi:NDP-sugar pyrophosphorylase family protein